MSKHYMNIDFDDDVLRREHPVSRQDVRLMLERSKAMGCAGVIWRCTTLGRADYRSRIMDRADKPFDVADHDAQKAGGKWEAFLSDARRKLGLPTFREARERYVEKSKAILADYDPPALVREITRELGMELGLWLDTFDEYAPGMGCRFLRENPHCQWVSRDGREHFEGLRGYWYPEAAENMLAIVHELAAYGPDYLYFSTSCHSRHKERGDQEDFYGFDDLVVARYRERHGIDIRTEDFDVFEWHRIKGAFFTDFVRKAAEQLHGSGVKLMLPAPIGDYKIWDKPLWSHRAPAAMHMDWRTWVDEGLADALIVGEYQPMWGARQVEYWPVIAERTGLDRADVEGSAARQFHGYAQSRCQLLYFSSWIHGGAQRTREDLEAAILRIQEGASRAPLDGVVWHEFASFERHDYYPRLDLYSQQ